MATPKWLDWLAQDVRFSARVLAKNPGFAVIAIVSLALGIGANTAIFSLVDNVVLKSLPVRQPNELAVLARNPAKPMTGFNYPDYVYIRDHSRSYTGLIAYSSMGMPLGMTVPDEGAHAEPQLVSEALVTGNYFDVLGVKPVIGRLFNDEDNRKPGAHPYALLSNAFWRSRFASDTRVIGKTIRLNGSPFTIVGVVAPGFSGTTVGAKPDLFLPVMMLAQVNPSFPQWNTRHFWWLNVMGRLKPGLKREQATAELDVLYQQIEASDPERRPTPAYDTEEAMRRKGAVLPGDQGFSYFRNEASKPLLVLMIVVGSVLLIACANVANLLLARAAGRQREIAIRLAVGAGRGRLMAQLVVEGLLVSVAGGMAGLLIAHWGSKALLQLMPSGGFPPQIDTSLDWRLLAFTCGVSVLTGIICGLAPALQATHPELTSALKADTSGTGSRLGRFDLRRVLVVGQVALAMLLVIGAGLFIRTLQNLKNVNAGFVRENVLLVRIDPTQLGYKGQRTRQFYDQLVDRILGIHGVRSASVAEITPLAGMRWNDDVAVQGYNWTPKEKPYVDFNAVGPRFFETLGIPILLGRDFRAEDNPTVVAEETVGPGEHAAPLPPPPPVAVVNESFARKFWPRESAIGKRFSLGDRFKMENSFEIAGVVKDVKYFGLREATEPMIYVSSWRLNARGRAIIARSTGDPQQLIASIRQQAREMDSSVPILQTKTMEEQTNVEVAKERIIAMLCGFFGALALLLAAVGLYGVMAQMVARRYREIGIRMALGAQRGSVVALVMRETAVLVGLGALIGVPASVALTRLVSSFLYGLKPQDPFTIAAAVLVLLTVTALATWIPARRAAAVDPMTALRWE